MSDSLQTTDTRSIPTGQTTKMLLRNEAFDYDLDETTLEFLWNNFRRYDELYESTNQKAAGLIAFNTFAMGGVMLNFETLAGSQHNLVNLGFAGSIILLISSLVSLLATVFVLAPFIKKVIKPKDELSLIFHEEILQRSLPEYVDACKTKGKVFEDIITQTYMLAKGLKKKYKFLSLATKLVMYGHIPGFTLLAVSFIGMKFI